MSIGCPSHTGSSLSSRTILRFLSVSPKRWKAKLRAFSKLWLNLNPRNGKLLKSSRISCGGSKTAISRRRRRAIGLTASAVRSTIIRGTLEFQSIRVVGVKSVLKIACDFTPRSRDGHAEPTLFLRERHIKNCLLVRSSVHPEIAFLLLRSDLRGIL